MAFLVIMDSKFVSYSLQNTCVDKINTNTKQKLIIIIAKFITTDILNRMKQQQQQQQQQVVIISLKRS